MPTLEKRQRQQQESSNEIKRPTKKEGMPAKHSVAERWLMINDKIRFAERALQRLANELDALPKTDVDLSENARQEEIQRESLKLVNRIARLKNRREEIKQSYKRQLPATQERTVTTEMQATVSEEQPEKSPPPKEKTNDARSKRISVLEQQLARFPDDLEDEKNGAEAELVKRGINRDDIEQMAYGSKPGSVILEKVKDIGSSIKRFFTRDKSPRYNVGPLLQRWRVAHENIKERHRVERSIASLRKDMQDRPATQTAPDERLLTPTTIGRTKAEHVQRIATPLQNETELEAKKDSEQIEKQLDELFEDIGELSSPERFLAMDANEQRHEYPKHDVTIVFLHGLYREILQYNDKLKEAFQKVGDKNAKYLRTAQRLTTLINYYNALNKLYREAATPDTNQTPEQPTDDDGVRVTHRKVIELTNKGTNSHGQNHESVKIDLPVALVNAAENIRDRSVSEYLKTNPKLLKQALFAFEEAESRKELTTSMKELVAEDGSMNNALRGKVAFNLENVLIVAFGVYELDRIEELRKLEEEIVTMENKLHRLQEQSRPISKTELVKLRQSNNELHRLFEKYPKPSGHNKPYRDSYESGKNDLFVSTESIATLGKTLAEQKNKQKARPLNKAA